MHKMTAQKIFATLNAMQKSSTPTDCKNKVRPPTNMKLFKSLFYAVLTLAMARPPPPKVFTLRASISDIRWTQFSSTFPKMLFYTKKSKIFFFGSPWGSFWPTCFSKIPNFEIALVNKWIELSQIVLLLKVP